MESKEENDFTTEPGRHAKLLQTTIISSVYFIFGILRSQEGVVFLDLVLIANADISIGSSLFTFGAVGFMVGVLVIGPLFDKVNNDILYCVCIFLAGVTTVIIPWCRSIYLMIAVFGLRSLFVGPADSGSSVVCSKIWLKEAGPYLQNLQFLFAMGGIIGPFITEPFLVEDVYTNSSGIINTSFTNTTAEIRGKVLDSTNFSKLDVKRNSHLGTNNVSTPETFPELIDSKVYIAFAITGGLLLTVSISFAFKIVVFSSGKFDRFRKPITSSETDHSFDPLALFPLAAKISCYAILAVLYFSNGCIEKILTSFLMTFVVSHLKWSKKTGSWATTVFWAGFAGGRFLGIILIKFVQPTALLFVNFVGLFITFGLMLLAQHLSWSSAIWWILIGTSGFFLSSVAATLYCWLDANLTPISGKLLSYVFVWFFAGTMTHMSLLGYLFEEFSPLWFLYLLVIQSATLLTNAVILFLTVRRFKRLYCSGRSVQFSLKGKTGISESDTNT